MSTSIDGDAIRPRKMSAFKETGLFEEEARLSTRSRRARPALKVRFRSKDDIFEHKEEEEWEDASDSSSDEGLSTGVAIPTTSISPRAQSIASSAERYLLIAFVLIISTLIAQSRTLIVGASGGPMPEIVERTAHQSLDRRADDPTNYCKRWSQQTAIVNGTLYLYGGRKTTSSSQTSNTWNNDFLTIDLTKTWQITTPAMSGLSQPSGPPPVANGYLWNSHESLYLYGGEFSDNPQGTPTANSLWEYAIGSKQWIEHSNPQTSDGTNSEAAGEPVQRAAEGAGFSLPSLGRGWYFGGHIDFLTTEGWSIQTPRVYLKSFIEYTFPGTKNPELKSQTVGSDGAWRNITSAGIQDQAGFTRRADGLLLYVPGFGAEGILLSLAGGTNETFTQMSEVDVFDIAGSQWYRQATSGTSPSIRVNPCAVVAAAADGSSYNIYMFGGQNLIPYGQQTQYDDMWILSVPSFTWIPVDMKSQSVPAARAGHSCNIYDSQMIVVGGYIGQDISCEQPGTFVFDTSSLEWVNQFTSTSGGSDNPFSQQTSQKGLGVQGGLEGSYGYQVPPAVQSVIGGNGNGGATITAPVQTATAGPLASGKPITYSVGGNGTGSGSSSNNNIGYHSNRSSVIGAIVAGVIAFLLLLLVIYTTICAFIYRKRLALYREHVAMMQEQQSEKDNHSFYAAHRGGASSPSWTRRAGHESLIGPYHRPSQSLDTSGQASSHHVDTSSPSSSSEDLMDGMQPTFWGWNGVLLHPRRSLKIVNRDELPPRTRDAAGD